MDLSVVSNLAALAISVAALIVSGVLAVRQSSMMRHGNEMPVLVDLMQELRSPEFQKSADYLIHTLAADNDPSLGCSNLPQDARLAVGTVSMFFTSLGALVAHDIADEAIVVTLFGFRANRAWTILEPYIHREREIRGDPFYAVPFEDLVCRVRDGWPPDHRYRLRYRKVRKQLEAEN